MKTPYSYILFLLTLLLFSCSDKEKPLDTFDFGTGTFNEPFQGLLSSRPPILVKSLNWFPYSLCKPDTVCLKKTFQLGFNEDCLRSNSEAILCLADKSRKAVFKCNEISMQQGNIKLIANTLNNKSIDITCTLSPILNNINLSGDVLIQSATIDCVNGKSLQNYNAIDRWHCEQKIGWPILLWLMWLATIVILLIAIGYIAYYLIHFLILFVSKINFPSKTIYPSQYKQPQQSKISRQDEKEKEKKRVDEDDNTDEWILLKTEDEIKRYIPNKLLDEVEKIRKRLQNETVDQLLYYRHRYIKKKVKIDHPEKSTRIILFAECAYCPMGNRAYNRNMNEFLCNKSLLSHTTYHVSEKLQEKPGVIQYETDRYGRVKKVTTNLNRCWNELDKCVGRNDTYIRMACKLKDGLANDDGGHLIAHAYNGPDDAINIVPMPPSLNRETWSNMENILFKKQWAANDSDVYMKIKYSCIGKKYRPQKITVQIGNQKKVFRYRDYDA